MRLLLAEDERDLGKALKRILEHENYRVDWACDGIEARLFAEQGGYDAYIFDIMMPGQDGLSLLRQRRQQGDETPALLLTARSQPEDKVAGLDGGADDYLAKPFNTKELLARVRAILRRPGNYRARELSFGDLTLNTDACELSGPAGRTGLAGKEYQLMELLMLNAGIVFSLERLYEQIWGLDSDTQSSVVWVYLSNLRKTLQSLGSGVRILSLRNQGYRLDF